MRITAMFHPIDKAKLERWALSRGYGYKVEMNLLSQGYLVVAMEVSPGSNPASVIRDMMEAGGVRVMKSPGVVMTPEETKCMLSGMGRLGEELREDDFWRDVLPGLEKMGFGIGRPGRDGPKYYMINPRAGEYADPKFGWPFGPEGLSALWGFVKGRSLSGWKEREVALDTIYKKQANKHLELGESAGGMGRLFEVVNPFQHGTRIRGMKRKRAGADLMLRKRSRKLRDGDYFW